MTAWNSEVSRLDLPKDLQCWAEEHLHLKKIEVFWSDIGLALVLRLKDDPGGTGVLRDVRDAIIHLARVVRTAGRMSGVRGPLVVIIDSGFSAIEKGGDGWTKWRTAVDDMANDQDWHRGEFSVFLDPPFLDGREEVASPRGEIELVRELLDPDLSKWVPGIPEVWNYKTLLDELGESAQRGDSDPEGRRIRECLVATLNQWLVDELLPGPSRPPEAEAMGVPGEEFHVSPGNLESLVGKIRDCLEEHVELSGRAR